MPTVKTVVDATTYAALVAKRKAKGLPSVSALFLHECNVLSDQQNANEIAKRAVRIAEKKHTGSEFRLKDLFPSEDWEGFSKAARISAGKAFNTLVNSKAYRVNEAHKSSSNHQLYRVIEQANAA